MTGFSPVIVHYHMYPGGVSSLILSSVQSLINSGAIREEVVFVLGTKDRSAWFFQRLNEGLTRGISIKVELVPELMYWDKSQGEIDIAAEKIKSSLTKLCPPGRVLWAHNPTLGKNPAYMLALKKIALADPEFRMFLHVHDSAEQGRWPNLNLMRSCLPESHYFISPGARWLVINRNDYQAFLKSGMPRTHLCYFPDMIVNPEAPLESGQSELLPLLRQYAGDNGYSFRSRAPWVLFAGRTIRRKNLLEALLVNLCAPAPTSFFITLPSDSPDDKPYEDMVFGQIKKHKAGAAGFGPSMIGTSISLSGLARACNLVMSSSVMEGFGLPYLEFPMMGRPVFARRIYTMKDFKAFENKVPLHFYDTFLVPVEKNVRDYQEKRYLEKVDVLSRRFQIPEKHAKRLRGFFQARFKGNAVDFSYLSASEQHSLIDGLKESGRAGIRKLNAGLFREFARSLKDGNRKADQTAAAIRSCFGAEVYRRNLTKVLNSYEINRKSAFNPGAFREKLLACYFNPEDLRLLLDYRPYF